MHYSDTYLLADETLKNVFELRLILEMVIINLLFDRKIEKEFS